MKIFLNRKKYNKFTLALLQLCAIGLVLLFIFNKEAILIAKAIFERLEIAPDFQMLIYRILLPFKVLMDSPSLCAIFFLIMHIICATYYKGSMMYIVTEPYMSEGEEVNPPKYPVYNFMEQKNYSYLKTMRLLF